MCFGRREQRRTLAIIAVGPTASQFAARLCKAIVRLYGGDPPIFAVGLHDPFAGGADSLRALRRLRGMRRRDFSLSPGQRRRLRQKFHWRGSSATEGDLAALHHELIRRVHRRRYPLENILWIADSAYVEQCDHHVRRVRQILDGSTLTALCFLVPTQAGASGPDEDERAILRHLADWNSIDPVTSQRTTATTILASPTSELALSTSPRHQRDLLARALAGMLFAPLQDPNKTHPNFSDIVNRLSRAGHPLAAFALEASALPEETPTRRRWFGLFGRRLPPSTDTISAHLAGRTADILAGEPVTTYGTLYVAPQETADFTAQAVPPAGALEPVTPVAIGVPGARKAASPPPPLQVGYLVPLRSDDLSFEVLATQLSRWLGKHYRIPAPSLLNSPRTLDVARVTPAMKGNQLSQVSILFGLDNVDTERRQFERAATSEA